MDRFKRLRSVFFGIKQHWRAQPSAVVALSLSATLAIVAGGAFWYGRLQEAEINQRLQAAYGSLVPPAMIAGPTLSAPVTLPSFSSSEFIAQFLSVAQDTHVPTDELSYVLETGTTQPYWRYRVTVDMKAGYPELRRFIAMLSSQLPNVSLDTIRCRRENVITSSLTCQLAFSAFFQKQSRG